MSRRVLLVAVLAASAAGAALATTTDALPYTAAQAKAGRATYDAECARCHGSTLKGGGGGPALSGPFWAAWEGRSLGELFKLTKTSMPADGPGRLSDDEYAAILAYMLQVDGRPDGPSPLPSDVAVLREIEITSER